MKNKKILFVVLFLILIIIGLIFVFKFVNKEKNNDQEETIVYPQLYLNSLTKDMDNIINNQEISGVTKDLINSYENSTLHTVITNDNTLNNFLYVGFISYLTDHNESTIINNNSKKEYLGKTVSKVSDFTVSKIYINGFENDEINSDNNISAIVFELSNKEYLLCQFVRTNNSTVEYDSKKYEYYDVLYTYSIYENYDDFVASIESTKYIIDEFYEISPDDFNKVMNDNKDFINNYVEYKVKYYYPNLLVETYNNDENDTNPKSDNDCYPAKPRYLCYEDGRCKCVSNEVYQCHKYNICSSD